MIEDSLRLTISSVYEYITLYRAEKKTVKRIYVRTYESLQSCRAIHFCIERCSCYLPQAKEVEVATAVMAVMAATAVMAAMVETAAATADLEAPVE